MALGPVGSAIFVNQQIPAVASIKADHNARFDFQNIAAQQIVNEEEKEIQEVRPTEENKEVDPDREHQKNEADQEQRRSRHEEKEPPKEPPPSLHKLDIKV